MIFSEGMFLKKEICYDPDMGLKLDLYEAADNMSPVFVYFYGGGLERGKKEDSFELACDLAEDGIAVVVPDYHICPGQPYPEFVLTAAKAVATAKKYADKRPFFIGGHSSGAYVAMMLCFGGYLKDMDVRGYIFASGQTTTHAGILSQRGEDVKRIVVDKASPLYNVSGKYPPILITIGSQDSFPCRVEQNALLFAVIRASNRKADVEFKILEGETHGSYLERRNNEASVFTELSSGFIKRLI